MADLDFYPHYVHFKPLIQGIEPEVKDKALEEIHRLRKREVSFEIKYDRMVEDYYHDPKLPCEITKIIRVIGGDGNDYVCCEHAYEPNYVYGKWDGSVLGCTQCRYSNYNRDISRWRKDEISRDLL